MKGKNADRKRGTAKHNAASGQHEHTPAPWRKKDLSDIGEDFGPKTYWQIKGGAGYLGLVAGTHDKGFSVTGYMTEADASMIEAAPDLAEALQAMLKRYASHQSGQADPREPAQARAALAKAGVTI